ncbi:hypothetical protein C8R44DRAFT_796453 [Mycena epipterygia]|nr:hypothetical protein C8R44DRAFT_796453 [Mycena epipterygia]
MTPVDMYTVQATVCDVKRAVNNHENLESFDTSLLVFGNGDGGGEPCAYPSPSIPARSFSARRPATQDT